MGGLETAAEHIRNALAIATLGVQVGVFGPDELAAVCHRLQRALDQLEGRPEAVRFAVTPAGREALEQLEQDGGR